MKHKILELLEQNPDTHLSGEAMGQTLHMTRANVWKEIQKLKKEGFMIESVRNRGYKLVDSEDNYSASRILNAVANLETIEILDQVTSTNVLARASSRKSNHLIIANAQTDGKGRMGRSFFSPHKHGIYMSLNLTPTLSLDEVQLLTICAALAVSDSLESLYGLQPAIKWLNDIYLGDRKVCGILTEGDIELELNQFQSLTIGIGINTHRADYIPEAIETIYTSVDQDINRTSLLIEVLNQFYQLYHGLPANRADIIDRYKTKSNVLGRYVRVRTEPHFLYKAKDISLEGHLIVEDETGRVRILNSGEISVEAVHDDK